MSSAQPDLSRSALLCGGRPRPTSAAAATAPTIFLALVEAFAAPICAWNLSEACGFFWISVSVSSARGMVFSEVAMLKVFANYSRVRNVREKSLAVKKIESCNTRANNECQIRRAFSKTRHERARISCSSRRAHT